MHLPQELSEQPPDVFLSLLITRMLDVVENGSFVETVRVILQEMLHGSTNVSPTTTTKNSAAARHRVPRLLCE